MRAARDRLLRDPPNQWTQAAIDVLAINADAMEEDGGVKWGTAMPTVQAEGINGNWVAKCPYCKVSDHMFILPERGHSTFSCMMSVINPEPDAQPLQFYAIAPAGPAPDDPPPSQPPYLTGTRVWEHPER